MNVRPRLIPANRLVGSELDDPSKPEMRPAHRIDLRIEDWGTPAFAVAFGKYADDFTTKLTENSDDAVTYLKSMGMLNDKGHLSSLYGGED